MKIPHLLLPQCWFFLFVPWLYVSAIILKYNNELLQYLFNIWRTDRALKANHSQVPIRLKCPQHLQSESSGKGPESHRINGGKFFRCQWSCCLQLRKAFSPRTKSMPVTPSTAVVLKSSPWGLESCWFSFFSPASLYSPGVPVQISLWLGAQNENCSAEWRISSGGDLGG